LINLARSLIPFVIENLINQEPREGNNSHIRTPQERILTKILIPIAGAKPVTPAVPEIEVTAPRMVTVAPALPAIPGAAKFKTSQHSENYTKDKIYQKI